MQLHRVRILYVSGMCVQSASNWLCDDIMRPEENGSNYESIPNDAECCLKVSMWHVCETKTFLNEIRPQPTSNDDCGRCFHLNSKAARFVEANAILKNSVNLELGVIAYSTSANIFDLIFVIRISQTSAMVMTLCLGIIRISWKWSISSQIRSSFPYVCT